MRVTPYDVNIVGHVVIDLDSLDDGAPRPLTAEERLIHRASATNFPADGGASDYDPANP